MNKKDGSQGIEERDGIPYNYDVEVQASPRNSVLENNNDKEQSSRL